MSLYLKNEKLFILIILLLISNTTSAQKSDKLSVRYITYSDNKPDESYQSDPNKMKYYLMMKEWMESVVFLLTINGKTSQFETIKKMTLWHEKANPAQRTMDKTSYYVDSITFIEQRIAFDELYLIEGFSNQINWELSNETKKILGYTCYKATYTYQEITPIAIEAWYAPKLLYRFGPMRNHGLPGLILEVVQNKVLHYEAIDIIWDDEVFIIKPIAGKKITLEALNKRYKTVIGEKLMEKN